MNKGGVIWNGRKELAEFLFNGDTEKAEKLLLLIESFTNPIIPPEFKNLIMEIPEDCKWCHDGECLYAMPDSMFLCSGKCKDYEQKED